MGVAFSHGKAHWAYSGFDRFRKRLAAQIGIADLGKMQGYGSGEAIPWETVHDPIVPLLDHSDCEDDLAPEVCATVAPRLRELISTWPDFSNGGKDFDKVNALYLAEGMEEACAEGKPFVFC